MQISVTLIIVIITCIVSILAFRDPNIMNRLIFEPYLIRRRNEWHRFISSGLLHGDIMHLAVNMLVLYSFGPVVEGYYTYFFGGSGQLMYVLLYISSIAAASATSYYKNADNPSYLALGASGAVSAVMFTAVLFQPTQPVYLYGIIKLPGFIWAFLYLAYSHYSSKQNRDNIGHEAHLYGAIYGVAFTLCFKPQVFKFFLQAFS